MNCWDCKTEIEKFEILDVRIYEKKENAAIIVVSIRGECPKCGFKTTGDIYRTLMV